MPQTDKITDIGNLQIERQNPKEKNIQVIPLVDDNKSRSERLFYPTYLHLHTHYVYYNNIIIDIY